MESCAQKAGRGGDSPLSKSAQGRREDCPQGGGGDCASPHRSEPDRAGGLRSVKQQPKSHPAPRRQEHRPQDTGNRQAAQGAHQPLPDTRTSPRQAGGRRDARRGGDGGQEVYRQTPKAKLPPAIPRRRSVPLDLQSQGAGPRCGHEKPRNPGQQERHHLSRRRGLSPGSPPQQGLPPEHRHPQEKQQAGPSPHSRTGHGTGGSQSAFQLLRPVHQRRAASLPQAISGKPQGSRAARRLLQNHGDRRRSASPKPQEMSPQSPEEGHQPDRRGQGLPGVPLHGAAGPRRQHLPAKAEESRPCAAGHSRQSQGSGQQSPGIRLAPSHPSRHRSCRRSGKAEGRQHIDPHINQTGRRIKYASALPNPAKHSQLNAGAEGRRQHRDRRDGSLSSPPSSLFSRQSFSTLHKTPFCPHPLWRGCRPRFFPDSGGSPGRQAHSSGSRRPPSSR